MIRTPDISAETCEGAAACASGSQTCSGHKPGLDAEAHGGQTRREATPPRPVPLRRRLKLRVTRVPAEEQERARTGTPRRVCRDQVDPAGAPDLRAFVVERDEQVRGEGHSSQANRRTSPCRARSTSTMLATRQVEQHKAPASRARHRERQESRRDRRPRSPAASTSSATRKKPVRGLSPRTISPPGTDQGQAQLGARRADAAPAPPGRDPRRRAPTAPSGQRAGEAEPRGPPRAASAPASSRATATSKRTAPPWTSGRARSAPPPARASTRISAGRRPPATAALKPGSSSASDSFASSCRWVAMPGLG